jgi:catechol-2,3-dioxygenase
MTVLHPSIIPRHVPQRILPPALQGHRTTVREIMLSGRFDHLVLSVHSIEASRYFYENVLGMKTVERNGLNECSPITE